MTLHTILHRLRTVPQRALNVMGNTTSRFTKPISRSPGLGIITDLARTKSQLVTENLLLRQQRIVLNRSVKRPRFTRVSRAFRPVGEQVTRLERGVAHCQAGDRAALASPRLPLVLDEEIAREVTETEDPG